MKARTAAAKVQRRSVLAALLMGTVIFGCAPIKVDPFADLETGYVGRFNGLTLALVLSENTKKSVPYLQTRDALQKLSGFKAWRTDSNEQYEACTAMLRRQFNRVLLVDRIEDAPAEADLTAVLDIYSNVGWIQGSAIVFNTKLIFTNPDRSVLEAISGDGRGKTIGFEPVGNAFRRIAGAAIAKLERSLNSSAKLREIADVRMSKAGKVVLGQANLPSEAAPAKIEDQKQFKSDVDIPDYSIPESPERYALLIGIEKYQNALPPADFAERDVQAVKSHLRALGYADRNIIFLTSQQASRSGIEKYLEEWLPRNVKEDSGVFFYFSGHGAPGVKTGEAYLLPWDGDPKFIESTGYPVERLYQKLNELKARKVIVALDSCFSGLAGRSVLPAGLRPLVAKVDTGAASVGKLVVFSASGADEATGAAQDQGHGLFTYYFLKGLGAKEGNATIKDLYDYLLPRVQEDARRDNRDQTPQLLPAVLGEKSALKLK